MLKDLGEKKRSASRVPWFVSLLSMEIWSNKSYLVETVDTESLAWNTACPSSNYQRFGIVDAADKLVKPEIMSKDVSTKNFPKSAEKSLVDTALEFVPTLLQTFLRTLFSGKDVILKLASLGQAFVQDTRGNPL